MSKRSVCCISIAQLARFDKGGVRKPRNCSEKRGRRHLHYPHSYVAELVRDGKAEWVGLGENCAIMRSDNPSEWTKVLGLTGRGNARVAAMQMLPGGEQRFPQMVAGGLVSPR